MTFNKHFFVSSRLILKSFIVFLSVQVNQSVLSTENTSRSLALARVYNLLFTIFARKNVLENPCEFYEFLDHCYSKISVCSNKNVYDLRD